MPERITVYYDYTCPYSNRALRWLAKVGQAGRELTVIWRAFPLKEVNRRPGQASFLSGTPPGRRAKPPTCSMRCCAWPDYTRNSSKSNFHVELDRVLVLSSEAEYWLASATI
jgi:hypothetical protein